MKNYKCLIKTIYITVWHIWIHTGEDSPHINGSFQALKQVQSIFFIVLLFLFNSSITSVCMQTLRLELRQHPFFECQIVPHSSVSANSLRCSSRKLIICEKYFLGAKPTGGTEKNLAQFHGKQIFEVNVKCKRKLER